MRCPYCSKNFQSLGIASHRAWCRERKQRGGLTAKQFVLKRYPEAVSWQWADCFEIYDKRYNEPPGGNRTIGRGATAQIAWDNAARSL